MKKKLLKQYETEIRERFILSAYTAWLQGAGQKKTFKQYLVDIGLEESNTEPQTEQITKTESKAKINQHLQNANRILLLDRRNKKKG